MIVTDWFTPDGPLARRLPAFEIRPQQQAMAKAVAAAFEQADATIRECERLDRELTADAEKVGGADYAALISLAYR